MGVASGGDGGLGGLTPGPSPSNSLGGAGGNATAIAESFQSDFALLAVPEPGAALLAASALAALALFRARIG